MISCEQLFEVFKKNDLSFFTGVPDSTFKDWMKFLVDKHGGELTNIIACNECEATAIASGHYLTGGGVGVVYMQNSGFGKTVNPLTSLCDPEVYGVPVLLMVGWRGEPGKPDEPQHKKMGGVMIPLLETLEIPYVVLPEEIKAVNEVIASMKHKAEERKGPVAIIIKKGLFEKYEEQKTEMESLYKMTREEAMKVVVDGLSNSDIIVSTTGKTSRELFECRVSRNEVPRDFYTVGSMGCSASIALGIALEKPDRKVFVFDGDGAVIMQMGALATIGHYKPKNFYHIIFDNASYESTGGQPTVPVAFDKVALGCGYKCVFVVDNKDGLVGVINQIKEGPCLIVIKVKKGSRKDLSRPTTTPAENKEKFMEFVGGLN